MVIPREQLSSHDRENSHAYLTDPFSLACRALFSQLKVIGTQIRRLSFLPAIILLQNSISIRNYKAS